MADISETLRVELRDPEYSEGYAESFLNAYVATQIKVIREQRKLTQSKLAEILATKQTVVSRIENVNYSAWNIKTLKKLARALKVRLRVSFESYGTLPLEVATFSREALQRPAREDDPGLADAPAALIREESDDALVAALASPLQGGNTVYSPDVFTSFMMKHKSQTPHNITLALITEGKQDEASIGIISQSGRFRRDRRSESEGARILPRNSSNAGQTLRIPEVPTNAS